MIAVTAGSTGLVGSEVLDLLLNDSRFTEVISLSRRTTGVRHAKLREVLHSDFTTLKTIASTLKGDVYFCALGTTIKTAGSQENFRKVDFDAVIQFGQVAKANSARAFVVVSSKGANPRSKIFYSRVKGEAEEALSALGLRRLVVLRPGLLMGDRDESRPGERFAIRSLEGLSPLLPAAWTKRIATPVSGLAKRMIAESLDPGAGRRVIEAKDI